MSKSLPEVLGENYKSESRETDEKKSVRKDLAHGNKNRTNQSHQDKRTDDPPDSQREAIDSILGLSSTTVKTILLAAVLNRDNALPIQEIIRTFGLNETEGDILKTIIDRHRKKGSINNAESYGIGHNSGAIQVSGSVASVYPSRRNDDNSTSLQSMFANIKRVLNNTNVSSDFIHMFGDFLQVRHASKENDRQAHFLHGCFPVATGGGGGDGDPEYVKQINPMPLGRSGLPADFAKYLIQLKTETSKEIHADVQRKEDNTIDISKTVKLRCSWQEKCEENSVDITPATEEGDDELLALANLLCCKEETDDILDVIYGLHDDMQHFIDSQAVEAEESQDDDDDDDEDSVANDSGSEAPDNGGITLLEDTNSPLQTPHRAANCVNIEVESNSYSGNHELAGTDQTIPNVDYWARQSQLTGTQSHQSTKSETHEIKHYLLFNNGSSNSMVAEEVFAANLTIDTTLQDPMLQEQPDYNHLLPGDNGSNIEGDNDAVEQAPDSPLIYLSFEQIVLSSLTMQDHLLFQFPQAEDQPIPLSSEVESSTEDVPEDQYVNAVETQAEDSEENEDCLQSSFVSSLAQNVDDEAEVLHVYHRRWFNCCLL